MMSPLLSLSLPFNAKAPKWFLPSQFSEFANNLSFRPSPKIPPHCSQERSIALPANGQDESLGRVNTASITNDPVLCSSSPELQQSGLPPLVSALKASAEQNAASFHFPGHNRGRAAPDSLTRLIGIRPYVHDLPELPELDSLFCPQGPILEAQTEAAKLFGSSETWFLVGGTTCGIQAAIMATCSPGEFLILPRNCHVSAVSAMVLSGAVPEYIVPDYRNDWDIAGGVTPLQVLKAIQELEMEGKKAAAVFITSPTYHGKRKVTMKESLGKVSGELICPYPLGIPVLIPGEVITERAVDYLLHVRSKGADISGASDPSLSSIVVCNV